MFCARQLPRHDVGVVLHFGDDNLIAFMQVGASERAGYQVDGLGGSSREDDFLRVKILLSVSPSITSSHLTRISVQPRQLMAGFSLLYWLLSARSITTKQCSRSVLERLHV